MYFFNPLHLPITNTIIPFMRKEGEPIRIGLIGTGQIGRKCHAEALLKGDTGAILVATADRVAPGIDGVKDHYRNHLQLLCRSDIDAIVVATPPDTHYRLGRDAIMAGKHLMVEKPPTLRMRQLENLERLAELQGVRFKTGYHATTRPEVGWAVDTLAGLDIVRMIIYYHQKFSANGATWLQNPKKSGGGVVWDHGINGMSVANDLIGNIPFVVEKKRVFFDPCPSSGQAEFVAKIPFSFGESGFGELNCDWNQENTRRFEIETSRNRRFVLDLVQGSFQEGNQVIYQHPTGANRRLAEEYPVLYRNFVDDIRNGRSDVRKHELRFVLDATAAAG